MNKLEHVTRITLYSWKGNQAEQSIFLYAIGEANLPLLQEVNFSFRTLSGFSLQKILRFLSKLRELRIKLSKVEDEDALVQVCAAGNYLSGHIG